VVPARVAAGVQYLQPVFGIAAASFLFGDQLGVMFAAGVILILGGLALAASNKRPCLKRSSRTNRRPSRVAQPLVWSERGAATGAIKTDMCARKD